VDQAILATVLRTSHSTAL